MSNIEIKQDEKKNKEEEIIYASMMYIFPFQPFIYILLKCTDFYTDFIKKHLKNSLILYSILIFLTSLSYLLQHLTIPQNWQTFFGIIILISFVISVILIFYIPIKSLLLFRKKSQ